MRMFKWCNQRLVPHSSLTAKTRVTASSRRRPSRRRLDLLYANCKVETDIQISCRCLGNEEINSSSPAVVINWLKAANHTILHILKSVFRSENHEVGRRTDGQVSQIRFVRRFGCNRAGADGPSCTRTALYVARRDHWQQQKARQTAAGRQEGWGLR